MRGSEPYQRCSCRDPVTKRPLNKRCPKLGTKGHALGWFFRYDAPRAPDEKRRQPEVGPFPTKKEAQDELTEILSRLAGGGSAPDRSLRIGPYLDDYLAGKRNLKPRTKESSAEAYRLYWTPALGHLRLVEVRDAHVSQVVTAMGLINRPVPDDTRPEIREMLRRMDGARADDERRVLPEGETRRKKSRKPLSPARIERMFAPFRAAMNAAVPRKIAISPCEGVELPRTRKVKPLAWTPQREAAFRGALAKQLREAEAAKGKKLTTIERQEAWAALDLRPCPVMVWLPQHTGAFLDFTENERLCALYVVVAYCGLRRDEVLGLKWAEIDLDQGVAFIQDTGSGDGPKSEAGLRIVPIPAVVVTSLKAWRKLQVAEQLAWGADWEANGLAFTCEDGKPVPGQWLSRRFETLAWRADLPPIRFHDLRHGAASLAKAAGLDTKYISEMLGHSRTSFTDSVYVSLFPEIQKAAAEAAAAIVPRRAEKRLLALAAGGHLALSRRNLLPGRARRSDGGAPASILVLA